MPEELAEAELGTYDPTRHDSGTLASRQWPPLVDYAEVADLILAIIRRRRTTTIEAQWDRRAVNAYLDSLPAGEQAALTARLTSVEPAGWATLRELRRYESNRQVKGRQAEAVRLLKETAQGLWPQTMTPGRLTQFGRRSGDEVFMVLPYESWTGQAEAALRRAVEDPHTTTGDAVRALITTRPFDLSLLS